MQIAIAHQNKDVIRLFIHLITELNLDVCWSSHSGEQTLDLCRSKKPDLLLVQLDLEDMKGSELIKQVMHNTPTTIIAICHSIKLNSASVFEAMSAGALDAFSEPNSDEPDSIEELKHKISNIQKLHSSIDRIDSSKRAMPKTKTPLVAIGSSTGGPAALLSIFKNIPDNTNAIWVIIQHIDTQFSQGMAEWLNSQTSINIEIAENHQRPLPGHVYMAGTNDHLILNSIGCFEYIKDPVDYPFRPSVDVFFESAVIHWPHKLIGVLLTGMGRDGANGLLSLYNRGMYTIAQNKESCAVHGMPKAACELNAVNIELDVNDIAEAIMKQLS